MKFGKKKANVPKSIISQFGGELDLQSTIADGADICKIRFVRPPVDTEPKPKKVK